MNEKLCMRRVGEAKGNFHIVAPGVGRPVWCETHPGKWNNSGIDISGAAKYLKCNYKRDSAQYVGGG